MTTRLHSTIGRVRATKPRASGATAVGRHASLRAPVDDAPTSAIRDASLSTVWIDRDLSWLEFNRRVLAEAIDERTPLLERVKFLAIFGSNLDEFFMKRMAVLREDDSPERRQLLNRIREQLEPMVRRQAEHFLHRIVPELSLHHIHLRRWSDLTAGQRLELCDYFDAQVSPALTPLIIHPTQPFPFFSNLSLSLAFVLEDGRTGETLDARVKVPHELPQWVQVLADVPVGARVFVRLHEVIRENAQKLYPGMRLTSPTLFRLTRDAEVEMNDDADQGVRELVRQQVRQRRYEPAVRLEFAVNPDDRMRQMLCQRFKLASEDVYELAGELDYTSLFQIAALDSRELRDVPWTPVTPVRLAAADDIFDTIRAGDLLVHHPYDSFDESVERFISTAAEDSETVAIKMTVYRVGDDTPFVRSLIQAAEAGKQVACVIELKARFDEARNLHWATELERAGAHVTVGEVGLKTHAKVALVVRKEGSRLRSYAHIGTGNYHVRTARLYTDVGLLTLRPDADGGRRQPLPPPDRPVAVAGAPRARGGSNRDASAFSGSHLARDRTPARRPSCPHRRKDEPARGPGGDRGAVRGVAGGRRDRPHRARSVLSPAGYRGVQRIDPHSLHHRPLPRAFANFLFRRWQRRSS